MKLLVTHGHPTMLRFNDPNLGRLVQPRHYSSIEDTARSGIPWAADNDAFNNGFDPVAFRKMLDALEGLPGCLFVTCPDVVGDAEATLKLYAEWHDEIHLERRLPVAFVLQDGITDERVPWDYLDAVFIGGSTTFKLGGVARELASKAKHRGKWLHMGRVNSLQRIQYAKAVGCDSIDGTKYSRYVDTYVPQALRDMRTEPQEFLS